MKYSHKWDNMNFEQSLEGKRRHLDEKIKETKFENKKLYGILANLKKEKEDMECSKEILENYQKFNHEEENLMKKMSLVGKRMDKLSELEFEKISYFKKILDVYITL